ncbi:MAG: DUF5916 domain-containing protein [Gemmatimonadales bacterium]
MRYLVPMVSLACGLAGQLGAQTRPTLRVAPAIGPFRLDGRLDEPMWSSSDSVTSLEQVEPIQGGAPVAATVVKVVAGDRWLAIAIRASTAGRPVTAFSRARDADLDDEDHVRIAIDPFDDGRSGYLFSVNPNGARFDALITGQGEGENSDWDAPWEAVTSRDADGWTVEARIPVASLSFPRGTDRWAFNVERRTQALLATDRWASARRDVRFGQTSQAGLLIGLPRFEVGLGLTVRPSLTAGAGRSAPDASTEGVLDGSVDLEQRLGTNLRATVTVSTDFAETEVDSRQANLTRFPLFFPEKRTFFLEGSDVFEFGLGLGTDLLPFFSRRIGLLEGREVPVRVGGKVTGQVGATRIGAIVARTGDVAEAPGSPMGVVRLSHNVLDESSVGMIATAGDPLAGSAWLVGADVTFRTSRLGGDKRFLVGASALKSERSGATGDRTAFSFKLDFPNDLFDLAFTYKRIGDGFDPPLGFVPRRGVQLVTAAADISPRPGRYGIRQMFFENRFTLATDLDGRWESYRLFFAPLNWRFESGDRIEVNANPTGERLREPFEVNDGVMIAPGAYRFTRYRLEVETSPTRRVSGQATWWFGRFYDGTLNQYELELAWRPASWLGFQTAIEHDVGRLPGGDFEATVASLRIQYQPSPDLTLASLVQYDDESRSIGSNSRLRWTITPLVELFVIYNHNVRDRLDRWAFDSNRLLAKLQLAWRR